MLLLTNMLILAFNIQPVKAAGGIIIRADGTIDPPTAPILRDGNVYTFTDNILDEIVVERSNIIVDGNGYTLHGSGSGSGFELDGVNNVTIQNTNIQTFTYGILLVDSSDNTISGNTITNNSAGIDLNGSSNTISGNNITNNSNNGIALNGSSNTISGNNIKNNSPYSLAGCPDYYSGIYLGGSSNTISGNNITDSYDSGIYLGGSSNTISGNNITDNGNGIVVHGSDNTIFHNNLTNNKNQIKLSDAINTWDVGYPFGGNYWSDYSGVDFYRGPYQNETGSDGVGDTPYVIDWNNQDNYPLVNQHIIPEFPSWTQMLFILTALAVAVVLYKRRLSQKKLMH